MLENPLFVRNQRIRILFISLDREGMTHECSRTRRSCRQRTRPDQDRSQADRGHRSEEHTSELQSLMRISYAVFCLKKKKKKETIKHIKATINRKHKSNNKR